MTSLLFISYQNLNHIMAAIHDAQARVQHELNRLRSDGREEDFEKHTTINSSTFRTLRFLSEDQDWLDRVPAADGSNLVHSAVWTDTYNWFKRWLSICHYQNVTRGQLTQVNDHASLSIRLQKILWFLPVIDTEIERSVVMRPFRKLYDQHATVLERRRSADGMIALMDADCEILAELLIAETRFENPLRGTHVEDVLLEKRFDRDQLDWEDPLGEICGIHDSERDGWWIRQLRQHGFRRPWKQLYLVLNDETSQVYVQTISDVRGLFDNARVERALDVQPIGISEMRDKNCAAMCGRHDNEEDGTDADFGEGDTVMLQFCGLHWIHATCAFQAWDVLGQNKFSFPCPMCRQDPGRLIAKLDIDIDVMEGNYNVGFDPEQEQDSAFRMIQAHLHDDFTLLDRQHMFPAPARRKALREQQRLLDYADEQDRYYDNILANWDTNPQNRNLRRPVHPRNREIHFEQWWFLYHFDEDDDPPHYEQTHWHEEALDMMSDGMAARDLPEHLQRAWRQWMDRGGWEEMIAMVDNLGVADELGVVHDLPVVDFAGENAAREAAEAAYAARNNPNAEEDEEEDEEEEESDDQDQEESESEDEEESDDEEEEESESEDEEEREEEEEDSDDEDEDGGVLIGNQPEGEDVVMVDIGDADAEGEDDNGQAGIQNALARWRKDDTVRTTVGRQMGGGSRAGRVRAVRAPRRSPRLKRSRA